MWKKNTSHEGDAISEKGATARHRHTNLNVATALPGSAAWELRIAANYSTRLGRRRRGSMTRVGLEAVGGQQWGSGQQKFCHRRASAPRTPQANLVNLQFVEAPTLGPVFFPPSRFSGRFSLQVKAPEHCWARCVPGMCFIGWQQSPGLFSACSALELLEAMTSHARTTHTLEAKILMLSLFCSFVVRAQRKGESRKIASPRFYQVNLRKRRRMSNSWRVSPFSAHKCFVVNFSKHSKGS